MLLRDRGQPYFCETEVSHRKPLYGVRAPRLPGQTNLRVELQFQLPGSEASRLETRIASGKGAEP